MSLPVQLAAAWKLQLQQTAIQDAAAACHTGHFGGTGFTANFGDVHESTVC